MAVLTPPSAAAAAGSAFAAGPAAVLALLEEAEQLFAVARSSSECSSSALRRARPRQVHVHDAADAGPRTVGHHHHAVGQQDRLVDVVGDADGGDLGARPHFHQHFLQLPARQRVEHAEGLVEQQQLRRQRERAREADPLLHAVGQVGGPLVHRVAEADAVEVVVDDVAALGPADMRIDAVDAEGDVLRAVSHGSRLGAWKTTPRSGPAASISRPSSTMPPSLTSVSPATIDSTVDLPQPEWPISETNSPLRMLELEVVDHRQRALRRRVDLRDLVELDVASRLIGLSARCRYGLRRRVRRR